MKYLLTYDGKINPKRIKLASVDTSGVITNFVLKSTTTTTVGLVTLVGLTFADPTEQEAV